MFVDIVCCTVIFGKWCHVWCFNLFKLFGNCKFTERFHFFSCAQVDFCLTIFVHSLYRSWVILTQVTPSFCLCALILGYAVCIFYTTDTKYVMFCIIWCKSLKGSTTPERSSEPSYFFPHITLIAAWPLVQYTAECGCITVLIPVTPVQYTAECGCITVLIPVTPVQYTA